MISTDVQARQVTSGVAFAALVLAIVAAGADNFIGVSLPGLLLLVVAAQVYRVFVSCQSQIIARNIGLVTAGVALVFGYLQWTESPGAGLMLAVFPVLARTVSSDFLFLKANIAYLCVLAVLLLISPVDEVALMSLGNRSVLVGMIVFFVAFNITQRGLENRRYMNLATDCVHDPLTKLLNRRGIDMFLAHHLETARREGKTFSVLMADIDHFKRFNDENGHAAGDEVLKRVGTCLQRVLRGVDQAGRLGGEEFLIVLPFAAEGQAMWVARRVRQSLAELDLSTIGVDAGITVSIGVAVSKLEMTSDSLIHCADLALYKAKKNGRNRCEIH